MTTFVTGASGFLGGHLVAALLARGDDVRAFVRDSTDTGALEAQGVEVVRGELADPVALARAAAGCPLVFHLAGIVSHEPSRFAELQAVNVDGIRNVLAAVEPDVRVVHVSSVAAVGPASSPDHPADERQAFPASVARLPYAATKHAGETVALAAAAAGADVVVANPGFLLGPGDVHRVSTWPVGAYLAGDLRFTTTGGLSFADVRDVAGGLVTLAERGRRGERTILAGTGGNCSWPAFFARIAAVSGVKRRMVGLPLWLAVTGATLVRGAVSPAEIRAAGRWWFYDGAKAEHDLDFRPRQLDETIEDTIADIRRDLADDSI